MSATVTKGADLWECPYCGAQKPSENGTGSDVACCGERGHATPVEPQDEALSARDFSHADSPLRPAARLYAAFSALVQRTWICSVARSLAGRGGRPRFGAFMDVILPTQKRFDKAIS